VGGVAKADPINPKPIEDPCRTQPGLELPFYLAANAADATAEFLDCIRRDRVFSLKEFFPRRVIGDDEDDPQGILVKLLETLDPFVIDLYETIDCIPTIMDPQRCPSSQLDQLLYHLGNPFTLEDGLSDTEKRGLASSLFFIYALKGACVGIIGALRLLFGLDVTECVSTNIDGWIIGVHSLNIDTILGGSSAEEKFAFNVMIRTNMTDKQREQGTNVVKYMKSAPSLFFGFIEPGNPRHVDHWELNFSKLNVNTFLH
jgi:phage tail-like protein